MACKICEQLKNGKKIYQDNYVTAFLARDKAVAGLIQVATNKHHAIFEHLSDYEAGHVFAIANEISSILVNYLKVGGVNIIVNNGVEAGQSYPHFVVNIVPRTDNDGMDFTWQPKQLSPEDLKGVYEKLLSSLKEKEQDNGNLEPNESNESNKSGEPIASDEQKKHPGQDEKDDEEEIEEEKDYLIRSIDRIP